MSRRQLITTSFTFLMLINTAVVGTLYFAGVIFQPSAEALEERRLAEEKAKHDAEQAARYAYLKPLPEFKSRVNYVRSMGEAINMCEEELHRRETGRKTWAINEVESRYISEKELYLIFIDYETVPTSGGDEPKIMKAICDVNESKKSIAAWTATKNG